LPVSKQPIEPISFKDPNPKSQVPNSKFQKKERNDKILVTDLKILGLKFRTWILGLGIFSISLYL